MSETNTKNIETIVDGLSENIKNKTKLDEKIKQFLESKELDQKKQLLDELKSEITNSLAISDFTEQEKMQLEEIKNEVLKYESEIKNQLEKLKNTVKAGNNQGVVEITDSILEDGLDSDEDKVSFLKDPAKWFKNLFKGVVKWLEGFSIFGYSLNLFKSFPLENKKVAHFFEKTGLGNDKQVEKVLGNMGNIKFVELFDEIKDDYEPSTFFNKIANKFGFSTFDKKDKEVVMRLYEFLKINKKFLYNKDKDYQDKTINELLLMLFENRGSDMFRDYSLPSKGVKFIDYSKKIIQNSSGEAVSKYEEHSEYEKQLKKGESIDYEIGGEQVKVSLDNDGKLHLGLGGNFYILDTIKKGLFSSKIKIDNIEYIGLKDGIFHVKTVNGITKIDNEKFDEIIAKLKNGETEISYLFGMYELNFV